MKRGKESASAIVMCEFRLRMVDCVVFMFASGCCLLIFGDMDDLIGEFLAVTYLISEITRVTVTVELNVNV